MQKRLEAKVTGRVQGMMYRDFAQRKARGLGLVGTVRNLPDGSVSVIAEGEDASLQKFIILLRTGPIFAKVDNVTVNSLPAA